MPDGAIVIPDTAVAPKDYTLSGAQEIALKTVRAVIDGSGAASAFLPTLQLLDPNGHVMWEGATSSTVAAGGSADVSWFPGLGATTSSTGTSDVLDHALIAVGGFSWPTGDSFVSFPFGSVSSTNPAIFHDNTGVNTAEPVLIMKAGVYIAWGGIGPWDPAWGTQALLANLGSSFGSWGGMGYSANNYGIVTAPVGGVVGAGPSLVTFTRAIIPTDPPGGEPVAMEVNQNSGASRTVSAAINIIRLAGTAV